MCLYNQNKNEQQQEEWEKELDKIIYGAELQRETRKSVEN